MVYNKKINLRNIIFLFANTILFFSLIFGITYFCDVIPKIDNVLMTQISVIISIVAVYSYIWKIDKKKKSDFGISLSLFLYLIATQLGMSTIYYLFGKEYLSSYSPTTLRFLENPLYTKAISLAIIAIVMFVFGAHFGKKIQIKKIFKKRTENETQWVYIATIGMLFIVTAFFCLFLLNGTIWIGMSYGTYWQSGIIFLPIYPWMLFLFAISICFSAAIYEPTKKMLIPFSMIAFLTLVFFTTGNRGEVLYPAFAAAGILYYRYGKLKIKYVIIATILLFIVIPFIKLTRHLGTTNSLDMISLDFFDAFAEMGQQLRLTVAILEDFYNNTREYIYGFSYINPLVNILDAF
ncbi:MAG: O-antigen polysaccharide polymerase Wzy, partial [Culicoidibacterales bacterium]